MSRRPDPSEVRPIAAFPGYFQMPDGTIWSGRLGPCLRKRTPEVCYGGRLGIDLSEAEGKSRRHFFFLDDLYRATFPGVALPPLLAATAPRALSDRSDARPIPGWEEQRYKIDKSRTIWRNCTDPNRPPPWDKPRWVRLVPKEGPGRGRYVELRLRKAVCRRSVALLYRGAFAPPGQEKYWARRLGPNGTASPPPEIPEATAAPRSASPPPAWLVERQRRGAAVREAALATAEAAAPELALPEAPEHEGYATGARHGRAKLTEAQVIEARRLHRDGWTFARLAERYEVSANTIMYAVKGKTWGFLPLE